MKTSSQTTLSSLAVSVCGALCVVLCGALLSGCIRDRFPRAVAPISFESSIHSPDVASRSVTSGAASRAATETGWRADDVIGVYMAPSGGKVDPDSPGAGAPHRHTGGGNFTAEPGHELFYPRVGTVDFTAYHPWRSTLDDHRYPIDLADQSDQRAIDFIWSNNASGHSSGDVPFLEFRHILSKIVFRVTDSIGGSLEGLGVVVGGLPSRAVFDLSQGLLAVTAGSEAPIATIRNDGDDESGEQTDDPSRASFEAIVLPGEDLSPLALFSFADGATGRLVPENDTFLGGKMYIYDVTVTEGGEVATGGGVIVDWDDGAPRRHNLPKVDPNAPGDPDEDPAVVWFEETMGTGMTPAKIAAYTDWDNDGVTVTDRFGGADVRSHGSLGTHIWFPPGVDADVRIEGLPAGYTDITLSYDIASATTGGVSAALLRVYAGTQNMTPWVSRFIPSPNRWVRVTLPVPDGTTSLRWVSDGVVNTPGMRLDNIRLEGRKR